MGEDILEFLSPAYFSALLRAAADQHRIDSDAADLLGALSVVLQAKDRIHRKDAASAGRLFSLEKIVLCSCQEELQTTSIRVVLMAVSNENGTYRWIRDLDQNRILDSIDRLIELKTDSAALRQAQDEIRRIARVRIGPEGLKTDLSRLQRHIQSTFQLH